MSQPSPTRDSLSQLKTVSRSFWRPRLRHPSGRVRTRLTREGFQFVFLLSFALIAAIIQNVNLLVLLAGALAGMVLLQWRLSTRSLHRLLLSRTLPLTVEAGRPFYIELTVRNPRRLLGSWWLVVSERLVPLRRRSGPRFDTTSLVIPIACSCDWTT